MKKFVVIFWVLLLFGCGETTVEKPDRLIKESVMVDIFYDLAIIDAMRTQKPQAIAEYAIDPDKYIYKKYKIDSIQFAQSNRYYASQIETYESMYERVAERLKKREEKLSPTKKKKTAAALKAS